MKNLLDILVAVIAVDAMLWADEDLLCVIGFKDKG